MNWRTIAVTAALLALQASILSLLHNSSAQAEMVYRCGQGDYRALPCHQAGVKSEVLKFSDDRTEAQLSQALSLRHQPGHIDASTTPGHRKGRPPSAPAVIKPGALSRHRSGMAPFNDGRDLSDAVAARKVSGRQHDPHRSTRAKPFVARSPKAGSQTGKAVTETAWR